MGNQRLNRARNADNVETARHSIQNNPNLSVRFRFEAIQTLTILKMKDHYCRRSFAPWAIQHLKIRSFIFLYCLTTRFTSANMAILKNKTAEFEARRIFMNSPKKVTV